MLFYQRSRGGAALMPPTRIKDPRGSLNFRKRHLKKQLKMSSGKTRCNATPEMPKDTLQGTQHRPDNAINALQKRNVNKTIAK